MSPPDINPTLLDFDLPSQVVAKVVVMAPVAEALDYAVPDGMVLEVGDHVMVPLAHHKVRGVVTALETAQAANFKLKAVVARLDDSKVPRASLEFWLWAAGWTLTPPGVFLNGCVGALKIPKSHVKHAYVLTGANPAKLTKARARVMEQALVSLSLTELSQMAGVSASVIKGLEAEGVLARIEVAAEAFAALDPAFITPALNASQAAADELLRQKQDAGGFCPVLLDGVTGSGKTEVYLETVARALLRPQAQVLILLPEIALTQAVMARLKARFGAEPVPWHSALTPSQRRKIWEGVASGQVRLVVGARSALFLPFAELDLIVVDEEHDGSYKQEEGVRYQARDLAVVRAHRDKFMVILASATPSLETLNNAQKGRYEWIRLTERHGAAQLPDIHLIDMKAHPPGKTELGDPLWLSAPLVAEIEHTLARKEQVLLFLNRRGYAPLVLCRACGERMTAPKTDSWLVEHRATGRLVCHLTGFSMKKPDRCPHCNAFDGLTAIGPGVERILEEVRARFPEARAEIFSSDTTPDAASSQALIRRVQDHETDILVATQAAAKGHNFLNLTLVGIIDADLGLKGGDLRAAERTFQLLAQATGRAGRAHKAGKALLQTYSPEHSVMQALKLQDREAFYAYEQMTREMTRFPPFGRLAAVILSSKDQAELNRFSRELALTIPNTEGVEVYGPADAPLSLIRGQWRKRFLVRADRNRDLQGFMAVWLKSVKKPNIIRMVTDIDPYSFL